MSNRLFIFDLDGVLVDSKQIHFDSLNLALKDIDEKYVISEEQQAQIFEGLSTNQKLKILSETRGLPEEDHEKIWGLKQKKSIQFFQDLPEDDELIKIFKMIKSYGVDIAVASNCIRDTVETCLKSLGIYDDVNFYLGNQDVDYPKPSPEIYLRCMDQLDSDKWSTVIFEDSLIGRKAALASGATLASINSRIDLTSKLVLEYLNPKKKKINVLIPMAGEGSRFTEAGYAIPKPLIEIHGKSMINLVYDSIDLDAHYIFIAKSEHIEEFNLQKHISEFCKDFTIIAQDNKLDGAALSSLLAKDLINNDSHLIIANSDQYVRWNSKKELDSWIQSGIDGSVLTFLSNENKWSYAEIKDYFVNQVHEKIVVGQEATCGIYYWKSGSDFVKYAEMMIEKGIKTNNEFYVAPVYNQAIGDGKIISYSRVKEMRGLGTPEDLEKFVLGSLPSFKPEDKSKYFFNNSDNLPKNNYSYVENIFRMTPSEICISYKNAKYEVFDQDKEGKFVNSLNLIKGYRHPSFNPVITSIDNDYVKKENEKSVFLIVYTTRFYHIYLEVLPKLFFLKKIDPDFKVIILGDDKLDKNKNFIGMDLKNLNILPSREEECASLKFWLDALDIEFECLDKKSLEGTNLTFEKSYMFYEKIDTIIGNSEMDKIILDSKKAYYKKWLNPSIKLNSIEYIPTWIYHRSTGAPEIDPITYTRNEIELFFKNKKNIRRRIYFSRKNYERVHPSEVAIENFYRRKGFEAICMEDFTPEEQINICRSASDIVCYVGSGMVNLYYLDPLDDREVNITVLSLDDPNQEGFVEQMYHHYSDVITSESRQFGDHIKIKLLNIPADMEYRYAHPTLSKLLQE
jgi:beta-phosphoglucomutase-like phosphatase (HAD superfamily)/dTDP-glucose pyrophosphorylase